MHKLKISIMKKEWDLIMSKFKQKVANKIGGNIELNRKSVQMKNSLDEVKKMLNSEKPRKKTNK